MPMQSRVGEILVKAGLVTEDQIKEALRLSKGQGKFIGQVLIEMGWCTDQAIAHAISKALNRQIVDLKNAMISQKVAQLIPQAVAVRYRVLPVLVQNTSIYVAMENPLDMDAIQQVEFSTGKQVIPLVAISGQLQHAIQRHYDMTEYVGNMLEHVKEKGKISVEQSRKDIARARKHGSDIINDDGQTNDIVKLTNLIFAEGIKARASDIHIEPSARDVNVRYRIDGILTGGIKLPKEIYNSVLSRIKVLAGMDTTDHQTSQDGHIRITYQQRKVDMRVSTMLTNIGEKVVIRILDAKSGFHDISRLGFSQDYLRMCYTFVQQPQGLILVTGPTGTGKTTTLYALLHAIKDGSKHIITIENPIEYQLEGVTQIQVNPKMGLTFANGLRTVLRQDPNVILLGEIRDAETASVAIQASETGHLVLSTLHTTDAVATVNRLLTLGISPDLIASNLLVVIAQQLLRKVCPRCRQEYVPSDHELQSIGFTREQADFPFYRGTGCKICRNTGYYGQIGLFELFIPNDRLRHEIAKRTPKSDLQHIAAETGMKTILDNGLEKLRQGITTIEEIVRVCYMEQVTPEKVEQPSEKAKDSITVEDVTPDQLLEEIEPEKSSFPVADAAPAQPIDKCTQCGTKLEKTWLMCPICGQPKLTTPGQDQPKTLQADMTQRKEQIVIAEDDADTRRLLKFLLKKQGYQVIESVDGDEALEKIRLVNPDMVILDINMPKRDGFSVCKMMRASVTTMLTPVMLLTAQDSIENKLNGLSLGADDYMTKPFHPAELLARVEAILRRSARKATGNAATSEQ